jgi:quercetin dioxygenase-like cupin family protein
VAISRSKTAKKYKLDTGVEFQDMAVKSLGTQGISVGLATFAPGALLPCHIHNCEESITILEGTAYCDVQGKRYKLVPYDTSHVPAGIPHRFVNASRRRTMVMLWVYASADVERVIQDVHRCMGLKTDSYKPANAE